MTRPTLEELRARVGAQSDTRGRPAIYAGAPGTGPAGETCSTCKHLIYSHHTRPKHPKCGLTRWTRGDATTIKTRTPACAKWERDEP